MNIDFHGHFVPASAVQAAASGKDWHGVRMSRTADGILFGEAGGKEFDLPDWTARRESVEDRLADLDSMRLDMQVLSIAPRLQRYGAERAQAIALARDMNDDLVELIAAAPDRLGGLIHLPLQDPSASVAELERMAGRGGIIGAAVGTNVNGAPWDSPELFPVLEAAEGLGLFMFFHPANRPKDERMRRYHLKNLVGNPLETTLAITALIFSGVLDRLPAARMCFAHAGGFAVLGAGRFDYGYQVRDDTRETAASLPSDYLKRLYYDSITFSERALRHIVDAVGVSQILLGSDHPADMGTTDPVGFIEGCSSLDETEKRAILGGNLEGLIGSIESKNKGRDARASSAETSAREEKDRHDKEQRTQVS
jgi:aminocarboxymuconate-semialdehyde decarboxylase